MFREGPTQARATSMNTQIIRRVGMALLVLVCGSALAAAADKKAVFGGITVRYTGIDNETGTSKATVIDACPLAHSSQMLPVTSKGEMVGKGDITKQTQQVLQNLDLALKSAKSKLKQTVKLNV